jgi:hypothetical protein
MEYEQRMEELEKLEYPKPLRDFIYETFNAFAERHPWVGEDNIRPKSIAREMFENFRSFAEYVLDYELQRSEGLLLRHLNSVYSEGLLLRHLNSVYKVLSQTVPDGVKNDEVREMELYLRTLLGAVDSSLEEEWERMRDPNYRLLPGAATAGQPKPPGAEAAAADITRDTKAFTALVRTRIFTFLRAWSVGDQAAALGSVDGVGGSDGDAPAWSAERLEAALVAYRVEHPYLRFDPEARNVRHTHVSEADGGRTWLVQQVLVDPELHNDWMAQFQVDLQASCESGRAVLALTSLGPIG